MDTSGHLQNRHLIVTWLEAFERDVSAIGTRLKRTGMHWSVSGANAIIALRCAKLSGRFEDFWERRSTPLKAAA